MGRWLFGLMGLAAGSYAAYVAATWLRYGKARRAERDDERDSIADRFLPHYEVAERHRVRVRAPAEITFDAACNMDLRSSWMVRAIFRAREWILGAGETERALPRGIVEEMKTLGWGVLEKVPGREIVLGAVTQPWVADVVFRSLPADEFAAFREPGFAKIVVSFRADPESSGESIFRTETRVATTDPIARAKFRRYWSFLSPGIILIRWLSLPAVKAQAERKARAARSTWGPTGLVTAMKKTRP
jgi:hypothetical protein